MLSRRMSYIRISSSIRNYNCTSLYHGGFRKSLADLEVWYDPLRCLKSKMTSKALVDGQYKNFHSEIAKQCKELGDFIIEAKENMFEWEGVDPAQVVVKKFMSSNFQQKGIFNS